MKIAIFTIFTELKQIPAGLCPNSLNLVPESRRLNGLHLEAIERDGLMTNADEGIPSGSSGEESQQRVSQRDCVGIHQI
jgi:hypothetical protein